MENGVRHGLGAVAGLVLTPTMLAGLSYGWHAIAGAGYEGSTSLAGLAVLAGAGVLVGLTAGSRLSPLASLIAGLAFGVLGVLGPLMVLLRWDDSPFEALPGAFASGLLELSRSGILLMLGVAFLVASFLPSRWRATGQPMAGRMGGPVPPGGQTGYGEMPQQQFMAPPYQERAEQYGGQPVSDGERMRAPGSQHADPH
ncbi:hypothetical protein ACIBG8_14595 [Nonomuraea sp. NPDC050556]|uniref:hypothetical protein n=1 Tax=Nonomuraea sp. NPDC050556 TaxID=3364369 RepID=UPI0037A45869